MTAVGTGVVKFFYHEDAETRRSSLSRNLPQSKPVIQPRPTNGGSEGLAARRGEESPPNEMTATSRENHEVMKWRIGLAVVLEHSLLNVDY